MNRWTNLAVLVVVGLAMVAVVWAVAALMFGAVS